MKRAIRVHRVDFAAIIVLVVAAIAVTVYILEHQPSFVFGQTYYSVAPVHHRGRGHRPARARR